MNNIRSTNCPSVTPEVSNAVGSNSCRGVDSLGGLRSIALGIRSGHFLLPCAFAHLSLFLAKGGG